MLGLPGRRRHRSSSPNPMLVLRRVPQNIDAGALADIWIAHHTDTQRPSFTIVRPIQPARPRQLFGLVEQVVARREAVARHADSRRGGAASSAAAVARPPSSAAAAAAAAFAASSSSACSRRRWRRNRLEAVSIAESAFPHLPLRRRQVVGLVDDYLDTSFQTSGVVH